MCLLMGQLPRCCATDIRTEDGGAAHRIAEDATHHNCAAIQEIQMSSVVPLNRRFVLLTQIE